MKTVQEIIPKTMIHFTKDTIELRDTDSTHTALLHVHLKKHIFSSYKIRTDVSIGIDIENMVKILKFVKPPMCLQMNYTESTGDHISLLVFKDDTCRKRQYSLPLYNLNTLDSKIISLPIKLRFTIASKDFYDLCSHLLLFGDSCSITINSKTQKVTMTTTGDIGTAEIEFSNSDDTTAVLKFEDKSAKTFTQSFSLDKWKQFSQAYSISDEVCLCFSDESPLLVHYKIKNDVGDIKFYLAPKIEDL
tara:strand:+ start:481 stop:1221 length:741 start_codon:yes stop_codon:yes gene_type:complete